jgi:hypothetical protein
MKDSFGWLNTFYRESEKTDDYAKKTLAAYRLGMKAGGSIRGVRIVVGEDCCRAAKALSSKSIYTPDEAPHLPLPECTLGNKCRCVYRPVMAYDRTRQDSRGEGADDAGGDPAAG